MTARTAVLIREGKIRATNSPFIFWDLLYPLGYLLVFGLGMNASMGFTTPAARRRLQRVLPGRRAGHGELRHRLEHVLVLLHGPRQRHLLRDADLPAQPLSVPARQGAVQRAGRARPGASSRSVLPAALLGVPLRPEGVPLLLVATVVGTAGWFFFYAIFALWIRRNDAFNTVTSVFYFVFLFASSMFYPARAAAGRVRIAALANPITWHVDVLRYATIGIGDPDAHRVEVVGFIGRSPLVAFLSRCGHWNTKADGRRPTSRVSVARPPRLNRSRRSDLPIS